MAAKQKVTLSVQPPKHRLSLAERRAAETVVLSTQQAELKREAAERRARRAGETPSASSTPGRTPPPRRSTSR
jgi:hypothetical protein